ncbi:sulfite exporter TauE/SafE family protein [Salinarimonas ramus]|uniref:Probable membrane transporter protein n=1 Tax=Salinarimonas ramus TaxID=690164 RepID=A0A917Q747_9HYPH|nr:sulfite exporter TauE/SafE family protein [Salinarimonas ramus]GGK32351.1 membrane protein [Salinarimonas ramus]
MSDVLVNIGVPAQLAGFPLWFAAVAAFVAATARGFAGFGAGLIFMPLASATLGPQVAAPVLLLLDTVLIAPFVPAAWRACDRRAVSVMTLGAYLGVPAGAAALVWVEEITMRWLLVALIVALLALLVSGFRYRGRPKPPLTAGVGVLSGFLSAAAQVGGPPAIAYWLGSQAKAAQVRANLVVFVVLAALGTAVAYVAGGLLTPAILATALVIAPFYGAGLFLGSRLFGLASETLFRRICYALIALAAIVSLPSLDGVLR